MQCKGNMHVTRCPILAHFQLISPELFIFNGLTAALAFAVSDMDTPHLCMGPLGCHPLQELCRLPGLRRTEALWLASQGTHP